MKNLLHTLVIAGVLALGVNVLLWAAYPNEPGGIIPKGPNSTPVAVLYLETASGTFEAATESSFGGGTFYGATATSNLASATAGDHSIGVSGTSAASQALVVGKEYEFCTSIAVGFSNDGDDAVFPASGSNNGDPLRLPGCYRFRAVETEVNFITAGGAGVVTLSEVG